MPRGRPKKIKFDPLELKQIALEKYRCGYQLSLEETAHAIWDPKTEAKPMSEMGILTIQNRAMLKLRKALKEKYNINSIDDIF